MTYHIDENSTQNLEAFKRGQKDPQMKSITPPATALARVATPQRL